MGRGGAAEGEPRRVAGGGVLGSGGDAARMLRGRGGDAAGTRHAGGRRGDGEPRRASFFARAKIILYLCLSGQCGHYGIYCVKIK